MRSSSKFLLIALCAIILTEITCAKKSNQSLKQPTWISVRPESRPAFYLMKDGIDVIQKIVCATNKELCYYVFDGASRYTDGFGRILMIEPLADVIVASIKLDNKNSEPLYANNSRHWIVRKDVIGIDHLKIMAAQPFITETLPNFESSATNLDETPKNEYEENLNFFRKITSKKITSEKTVSKNKTQWTTKKNILNFGLGGASLNNFFDYFYPQFNIVVIEPEPMVKYLAKTYFGLNETENHQVIVTNPETFVNHMKKSPSKFDFITVDLCYHTVQSLGACPTNEFRKMKIIRKLASILSKTGTFVMNVFDPLIEASSRKNLSNSERTLLNAYRKNFRSCYYVAKINNLILTCTNQDIGEMNNESYAKKFNMAKLPETFGYFSDLNFVDIYN